MKIAKPAICALLVFAAAGVAVPQTPSDAPCPVPPRRFPGGGASNAYTVAPPNSPLIGLPNPYRPDYDWLKLPAGRVLGGTSAIAIDADGKSVWIFERCGNINDGCALPQNKNVNPVMEFDFNGNLVRSWGAGMFVYPHGIFVDAKDHIWLADGNVPAQTACLPGLVGNTVREFTRDGKLLLTIGPGPINGKKLTGFTSVVVAPNGDIFVADGHGGQAPNDRILKFDSHGKFLMEWGSHGPGAEQFSTPHGMAIDKEGRIYVADRGNKALKVFDENGKLLHDWKQFGSPAGVYVRDEMLYVCDEEANGPRNPDYAPGARIASVNDGKIVANIPYAPGNAWEGIAVDAAGNVYAANTNQPRAVRFIKLAALAE